MVYSDEGWQGSNWNTGPKEDMPGKFIVRIPSAKNKSLYIILTNPSIQMSTERYEIGKVTPGDGP